MFLLTYLFTQQIFFKTLIWNFGYGVDLFCRLVSKLGLNTFLSLSKAHESVIQNMFVHFQLRNTFKINEAYLNFLCLIIYNYYLKHILLLLNLNSEKLSINHKITFVLNLRLASTQENQKAYNKILIYKFFMNL